MKISIIIPAFNEENYIIQTLAEIYDFLSNKKFSAEIIVVNDGSSDKTREVIEKSDFYKKENFRLLNLGKNQGKGMAVKTGLLAAIGEYRLFMDADNSTKIAELEKFLPAMAEQHADIVIGSRALSQSKIVVHQPKWKETFGKFGNKMIRLITGLKFHDTQCGFKLFNKKSATLFQELNNQGWAFDVEILYRALKKGYKILELPVSWSNDHQSKVTLKSYPLFLRDIIKIRINK